jgi:hypothetical protein
LDCKDNLTGSVAFYGQAKRSLLQPFPSMDYIAGGQLGS